ncbi:hypothetical protein QJS04_geneDACA009393 [Acorus gramineus]|uniref:Uncharacterized protein n=1 Tax=Acorus gramineus TaxID=55184 RepID=A0AAV9AIU5_ACOGR|nr:hypothetical protein QJS04_geneDACA009393 [Acorus gramineus]
MLLPNTDHILGYVAHVVGGGIAVSEQGRTLGSNVAPQAPWRLADVVSGDENHDSGSFVSHLVVQEQEAISRPMFLHGKCLG